MPQTLHQAVVAVLRDDPPLAFDLARWLFDVPLGDIEAVQDRKGEIDRLAPSSGETGELRPDLVLSAVLRRPAGAVAMVVEVQRKVDRRKRWRIWVYWALVAERFQCTTIGMVISLNRAVSKWLHDLARAEIPQRQGLLVVDRQNMPRITDINQARQRPCLAILSALLHVGDVEVLRVAFTVAREFSDERRWRYLSALLSVAPEAERSKLSGALKMAERYELTRAERNSIAFHDGKREGQREGKREGLIELVFTVLELRGITVGAAARAKIRKCRRITTLERWVARAKSVEQADELFA